MQVLEKMEKGMPETAQEAGGQPRALPRREWACTDLPRVPHA